MFLANTYSKDASNEYGEDCNEKRDHVPNDRKNLK